MCCVEDCSRGLVEAELCVVLKTAAGDWWRLSCVLC